MGRCPTGILPVLIITLSMISANIWIIRMFDMSRSAAPLLTVPSEPKAAENNAGSVTYIGGNVADYGGYKYNRKAAVGYSDKYWDVYNPNYNNYASSGGDCANFVSQCLIAGGITLVKGYDGNGAGVDNKGCMPFCDYLHLFLVKYAPLEKYMYVTLENKTAPEWLEPGDVIIFGNATGDKWQHAVFVVGGTGNTSVINCHTTDRYHVAWDYGFPGAWTCANFYKISDDILFPNLTRFRVVASAVNVRAVPDSSDPGNILCVAAQGMEFMALETVTVNGLTWYRFQLAERTAYIAKNGSSVYCEPVYNNTGCILINVSTNLNVRTGPGTGYGIINKVFDGQPFVFKGWVENGSIWYRTDINCTEAWISASYTEKADLMLPEFIDITNMTTARYETGVKTVLSFEFEDDKQIADVNITVKITETDGVYESGRPYTIIAGNATSGKIEFNIDIPDNAIAFNITVILTDLYNRSVLKEIGGTVRDVIKPTITDVKLYNNNSDDVEIKVNCTDNIEIISVICNITGSDTEVLINPSSHSGPTYTFRPSSVLKDGNYTASITVTDTSGNSVKGSTFIFTVNSTTAATPPPSSEDNGTGDTTPEEETIGPPTDLTPIVVSGIAGFAAGSAAGIIISKRKRSPEDEKIFRIET